MNKIILVIVINLLCIYSNAQAKEYSNIEKNIKKEVNSFFIKIGRISREQILDYNAITIYEILEKRTLGYDDIGVYFCTDLSSHSMRYIILKDGNTIKILNSSSSAKIISEISLFFVNKKFSNIQTLNYLKEVISILNSNLSMKADITTEDVGWVDCN